MRSHRLTLLVSNAEKERIARQADALGMSAGDYARSTALLLDAGDMAILKDVRACLPDFNAALGRIHANLAAACEQSEQRHEQIARMRTPEFRAALYGRSRTKKAGSKR